MLVKDVPVKWNPSGQAILLLPILEHIRGLGKILNGLQVSYFSEKDKMDVFIGVDPVNADAVIPSSEFTQDKLQIRFKPTETGQARKTNANKRLKREMARLNESSIIKGKRESKKPEEPIIATQPAKRHSRSNANSQATTNA
jgi:hypothetical protein